VTIEEYLKRWPDATDIVSGTMLDPAKEELRQIQLLVDCARENRRIA